MLHNSDICLCGTTYTTAYRHSTLKIWFHSYDRAINLFQTRKEMGDIALHDVLSDDSTDHSKASGSVVKNCSTIREVYDSLESIDFRSDGKCKRFSIALTKP